MIAEASLEEVRERTDIVEVVREYVPSLKRAGRNHKACCPFHQERTPSFMVNPDKQIFHCFGCHEGGDVFKFLMKLEGLSFPEAVEKLAERAGVRVAPSREQSSPEARERSQLRQVLEQAAEYYRALLKKQPEDSPAVRYLAERGLSREIMEEFRIGFAPSRGTLYAAASKKGHPSALLEKAGLTAKRQGGGYRDYFFNRILFPIENAKGEVVGFGARTMGDGEPKYLNSPETPVFSKGRVLYGLRAAIPTLRKTREALLLEGYMDVLTAHQFGLSSACAPLGTALTEEHAVLLKRHVDRAVVVFDPDAAGLKAAVRGAEVLLEKGVPVTVATLAGGLDPDEFLRKNGAEAFREEVSRAKDLPAFKTERLLAGYPATLSPADKSEVAADVLETIRKSPDEILRGEWLRALAQRLGIDEESLYHSIKTGTSRRPARRRDVPARTPEASPLPIIERDILFYLFRSPGLAVDDEFVAESDLADARARRIFTALRGVLGSDAAESGSWTGTLLERLGEEEAGLSREILCDEREAEDPASTLARIIGRRRKERRIGELKSLVFAEAPPDPEIAKEYHRLLSDLKGTQKGDRE